MTEVQNLIREAYEILRKDRGDFYLFALLEPEESPDKWDLIMSAPWVENTLDGYRIVGDALKGLFKKADWDAIGHFVIVPKTYPAIAKLAADRRAQAPAPATLDNFEFADVPIRQAVLFRIPPAPKPKRRPRPARAAR